MPRSVSAFEQAATSNALPPCADPSTAAACPPSFSTAFCARSRRRVGVGVDHCVHEPHSLDVHGGRDELVHPPGCRLLAEPTKLVLQPLVLLDDPASVVEGGGRVLAAEGRDQTSQQPALCVDLAERIGTRRAPRPGACPHRSSPS